jgi:hypothetical protein
MPVLVLAHGRLAVLLDLVEPLDVQPDGGRRMAYEAWLRGLRP